MFVLCTPVQEQCHKKHGELLTGEAQLQNLIKQKNTFKGTYLIGLTDLYSESKFISNNRTEIRSGFRWTNGFYRTETTHWEPGENDIVCIEVVVSLKCMSGEPNNFKNNEDCTVVTDGVIDDRNCGAEIRYICQPFNSKSLLFTRWFQLDTQISIVYGVAKGGCFDKINGHVGQC